MLVCFSSQTRFPRPFFEVQLFSWFCNLSHFVLVSQYFVSDKFSSYTSQCIDILSTQDTQLLTVFRCSLGCNFSDLKLSLITGFSNAISSCRPCLWIPVSSLCWLLCLPEPVFSTVSQHKTDPTVKASVFWWFSTLCQLSWSWPKKAGWKESETLAGSTEISLGCHRANPFVSLSCFSTVSVPISQNIPFHLTPF